MLTNIECVKMKAKSADFQQHWLNRKTSEALAMVRKQAVPDSQQVKFKVGCGKVGFFPNRILDRLAQAGCHVFEERTIDFGIGNTLPPRVFAAETVFILLVARKQIGGDSDAPG